MVDLLGRQIAQASGALPPGPARKWASDLAGRPVTPNAVRRMPRLAAFDAAARGVNAFSPSKKRSEEHTSELQSLMRISYAVFCLKKKKNYTLKATLKQLHKNDRKVIS